MIHLRLRGGGHVVGDDGIRRVGARVRSVPDRDHDQRHNADDERRADDKFDHLRTAVVIVKLT